MATSPKEPIAQPRAEPPASLGSIEAAFARGDARTGELLVQEALDGGQAWDDVTRAAARGVTLRFAATVGPAPA